MPRADWAHGKAVEISGFNIARMVDVVGVDHVGIGTDQLGLLGPSCLPSYTDLPQLVAALSSRFKPAEISRLLGSNYRRVFEVCIA